MVFNNEITICKRSASQQHLASSPTEVNDGSLKNRTNKLFNFCVLNSTQI